jgi:CRISP-associated protein Cas1
MRQILNTLYVMTQRSYLRLDHETLRLETDGHVRLNVPMHHLGGVVLFGNVMMTPMAMHRCAEDGRAVVLLDENGRFKGRLEGPQSGNVLLRRAQHETLSNRERVVAVARCLVAGKIHNSRSVLLRAAREADGEDHSRTIRDAAEALACALRSLPAATEPDQVRGIEGQAAKVYFSVFGSVVRVERETFRLDGRTRRPPRDPMNALLSFLYALLLTDCVAGVEAVGLDPQVGYLHVLRPGRPALALDVMEELRPLLADRVAFTLVNRRQVTARHFETRPGGAVFLAPDARKEVVSEYQRRKQEEVTHPELGQKMPLALVPFVQARILARWIRGDLEEYVPFVPR